MTLSLLGALVLLLVVASLLLQGEALSSHATSGMDTTFAMAFEAAYLLVALRSERSRSVPLAVFLGVMAYRSVFLADAGNSGRPEPLSLQPWQRFKIFIDRYGDRATVGANSSLGRRAPLEMACPITDIPTGIR